MKTKTRVRLNLEFPPQIYEQMQSLQKRTHAASLTELLRHSLALYDLASEHIGSGGDIWLENRDGTKEKLWIMALNAGRKTDKEMTLSRFFAEAGL